MTITSDIQKYINQSVLCWLATVSLDGMPNVSPKEIFTFYQDNIIIANIASPNTVKNIKSNDKVCLSFIDVLVQKGYQLKGTARIVEKNEAYFKELEKPLIEMAGDLFSFSSITIISVDTAKPIISPRYLLYPDTKESDQIQSAITTYKLNRPIL